MEKKQILKEQEKQYFFEIPKDKNGEEIRLGEIFTTPLRCKKLAKEEEV